MGNCVGTGAALSRNEKVVSHDEEDVQKALVAGEISSSGWEKGSVCNGPLPLAALLKSPQKYGVKVGDGCNGQRVKIVVTKKQLQLLMKSVEELKLRHLVIQSVAKRGRKWRPSLATIPEL